MSVGRDHPCRMVRRGIATLEARSLGTSTGLWVGRVDRTYLVAAMCNSLTQAGARPVSQSPTPVGRALVGDKNKCRRISIACRTLIHSAPTRWCGAQFVHCSAMEGAMNGVTSALRIFQDGAFGPCDRAGRYRKKLLSGHALILDFRICARDF